MTTKPPKDLPEPPDTDPAPESWQKFMARHATVFGAALISLVAVSFVMGRGSVIGQPMGIDQKDAIIAEKQRRIEALEAAASASASASPSSSAPPAPSSSSPWPDNYPRRLDRFCRDLCKGGLDQVCFDDCSRAYNKCGILHDPDILNYDFRHCVYAIGFGPLNGGIHDAGSQ